MPTHETLDVGDATRFDPGMESAAVTEGSTDVHSDDGFPGYPRGWFVVALAEELAPGASMPLRYFGRDLVASRAADGRVTVVDASVEPSEARPTGDGHLVLERNGFVFVHYDPEGRAPAYDIPVLPQWNDPTFTRFRHGRLTIRTHSREILENVVDVAHFAPVHKNVPLRFENEFDGHRAVQRSSGHGMGEHATTNYDLVATYYGPSYQITEMHSVVETILYNAHTMIDERTVDLRFGVMIRPGSGDPRFDAAYVEGYVAVLMNGFRQDARIWEHKRWRSRPVLCDGDGPILKLRRWYAQYLP